MITAKIVKYYNDYNQKAFDKTLKIWTNWQIGYSTRCSLTTPKSRDAIS